jgi:phage terminase small subunit
MPRPRDPRRDEAFEIWKASGGEMKLKDIAAQLGVSDTQIRKWKNLDQWEQKLKGNVTIEKRNVTNTKDTPVNDDKPIEIEIDENNELTEKQRLFCLYYLKYFNATKAYQKAYKCSYEAAHSNAHRLMANEGIKREIERLKKEQQKEIMVDARDVLQKYIDIAFADITDYVSFGQRKEQVIGMYDKQQQTKKDTEQQTNNKTFLTKDEFNKQFKLDSSEKQYENGKFQLKDGSTINADYLTYGESELFTYAIATFYQGKLVHLQVETDKSLEEIFKGLGITPTKDIKVETQNWGDTFVHDITLDKTFDDSNIAVFPNEWD